MVPLLKSRPTFSVLMPVYDTPERYLREAIDSVIAQAYPYWELCIADDASSAPHVRAIVEEYTAADSRIKAVYRETNGHIAAASNSALALATGDFVALLDHDDALSPDALFENALVVNRHPDVGLVYSDEDKIDDDRAPPLAVLQARLVAGLAALPQLRVASRRVPPFARRGRGRLP